MCERRRRRPVCAARRLVNVKFSRDAVVRRQAQVAERQRLELERSQVAQRVRVAGRLGHLDAVGQQVLAVHPDARERRTPVKASLWARSSSWCGKMLSTPPVWMSTCGPRCWVLMAVHSMCQPGKPDAPRTRPHQLGSARLGRLPQGEVARVVLERIGLRPYALAQRPRATASRPARRSRRSSRPGSRRCHCVRRHKPGSTSALRDLDHARRHARWRAGTRRAGRMLMHCSSRMNSSVKRWAIWPSVTPALQRFGDDLVLAPVEQLLAHVADVGDVLDVAHRVAARAAAAAQPVGEQVRAQVAQVDRAVHGRAAGVHAHGSRSSRQRRPRPRRARRCCTRRSRRMARSRCSTRIITPER